MSNQDPTSEDRKKDHISLAISTKTDKSSIDQRFNYEPLLKCNNIDPLDLQKNFLGATFLAPIWISSMTGGTAKAGIINRNLSRACKEFKLGMGLGSCRSLLHENKHLEDFALRKEIGDQPLWANLGIAQVEVLVREKKISIIREMINKLEANGLIIHINPLQEWMQPEGDRYYDPPIETIEKILDAGNIDLIVKEVGHGMGPKSLHSLMKLPLKAIEFAAFGGTNFSKIELERNPDKSMDPLAFVGHTAEQMIQYSNEIITLNSKLGCKNFIVSGGVKNFLDGHYLIKLSKGNAIYGQASGFLQHAMESYENLQTYVNSQIIGLALANQLLDTK